jgi:hypothetical protein
MPAPDSLPHPIQNQTAAGFADRADDIVGADLIVGAGDYTGGTVEDEFVLTAHGLATGDYVFLLHKSAAGAVLGKVGTRFRVKRAGANNFQVTNDAGTVIEHTADGTAVFLKATAATKAGAVATVVLPRLIVADGDYTDGATEDMFTPRAATGYHGLQDTDTLKLLYKSAAGAVTGIAVNTTVFAKSVTTTAFELAATSGGADIENTADGVVIFLKTS